VPAQLEPRGSGKRLTEDQAGPVVESFKSLRIQVVDSVLLTPWLGCGDISLTPTPRVLAQDAVQPAA
jgi:hypothetical protein